MSVEAGLICTSCELRNDRLSLSVPYSELRRSRFATCESTIDISLLVPTKLCSWPFRARKRPRRFHSHHVSCCTLLHWQSYLGRRVRDSEFVGRWRKGSAQERAPRADPLSCPRAR